MEGLPARNIGEICMGLHVRRAARRITRLFDEALAHVDLTIGQFSLLTVLAGQESWGMQPLANVLGTDRSSLTASLKPLERRQLVTSRLDVTDRRVRHIELTPAGSDLLDRAVPCWRIAQDQTVALLGEEQSANVRTIFERLS